MTDSRTTKLLREGLTEHGIEWRSGLEGVTFVGDWCFVEYDNGKLAATCEPVLTPEQAIAATLGKPMKKDLRQALDFMRIWISDDAHLGESELSYEFEKAEGLRKLEAIEQAIAATLGNGTLTAEQVRECVQHVYHEGYSDGSVRRGAHIDETDWQAIADELNARAERTCKLEPLSALAVTLNMLDQTEWGVCSECGCAVPMDARFCNECGKAVSE